MNNESGSALQKASFALLVFIAAALAYLIVRDRVRNESRESLAAVSSPTTSSNERPTTAWNPAEMKSSFAPLRPRPQSTSDYAMPSKRQSTTSVSTIQHNPAEYQRPAPLDKFGPIPAAPPVPPQVDEGVGMARGAAPSVIGRVFLKGQPPPEKQVTLDPTCARLRGKPLFTRHFVVGRDRGLANVVVYIKEGAPKDETEQVEVPVLDVSACEYEPYHLTVRAAQPFMLRNSSPILENVALMPKPGSGNRAANIALPVRGMVTKRVFDFPEMFIKAKCDVHPWMFAYVSVFEHRWFAVTDANGAFALPSGLPPGQYTLAAAHLKAGEAVQQITVSEDGAAPTTSFTLEVPKALAANP